MQQLDIAAFGTSSARLIIQFLYPLQNYSQIIVHSEVHHVQQILVLKKVKFIVISGTKQKYTETEIYTLLM